MTSHYDHAEVLEFWQYVWDRDDVYRLPEEATDPTYVLGMFPYTSGTLHMGHVRNYAITDATARYRRMRGEAVLHPMGWDAFGLPAENAALERNTDPRSWTEMCIRRMREELQSMGFGYDWSREITTCEPSYYRWNQWLFKRLYEAGLVSYEGATVNWCPDCETVLADAQVERRDREPTTDGADQTGVPKRVCWRCETPVGRRELDQWFFTITDYAEELDAALDDLDGWPEGVREIQRNWIGRRDGARIVFDVPGYGELAIFTTRPDTVFGATYLAVSPGHDLVDALLDEHDDLEPTPPATVDELSRYVETTVHQRHDEVGYAGVDTGITATHPLTGDELPVYVAGYVLEDVGTGAVMGVPGHNERDHAFATENDLPVDVVVGADGSLGSAAEDGSDTAHEIGPYTGEGTLRNSGEWSGVETDVARERLPEEVEAIEPDVTYRLRDWLISRQRYWGTPIPVVHCEDCGHVLVPDDELPVELPEFVHTTGNPLAETESFVHTECPDCGSPARRETDTMDTFVDSSWYFLRFLTPDLADAPFDPDVANETLPIDVYVGGDEHATLHLLYIRFIARALADLGLLEEREPVERLLSQGTVLYDGEKMSTSRGNVVAPAEYGAETTRLFVLSAAHPEQDFEWTANDVGGAYELQGTLYEMVADFVDSPAGRNARDRHDVYLDREIDRTIAAVTTEYDRFRFHRAVTEIRRLARLCRRYREYGTPNDGVYRRGLWTLAALVAPMAPHLAEELWNRLRCDGLVVDADWPEPDHDVGDYRRERRLVETTLEDVREIVDVADITAPETIDVVVAEDWKYRAARLVAESEEDIDDGTDTVDDETAVERAMADDALRARRDRVVDFITDRRDRRDGANPLLGGDRECALLERAGWLLEDEFDATVSVRRATENGELARKARPGKPAIRID